MPKYGNGPTSKFGCSWTDQMVWALGQVEMEVLLPAEMTVAESHDIALVLQHKVKPIGTRIMPKQS